jgi:hypothetical protein
VRLLHPACGRFVSWRDALEKHGEQIQADVDAAPALTPEQRARLAAIFAAVRSAPRRRTQHTPEAN